MTPKHRRDADRNPSARHGAGPLDLLARLALELGGPLADVRHHLSRAAAAEPGGDVERATHALDRLTSLAGVMRELAELDPTPTLGGDFHSCTLASLHEAATARLAEDAMARRVRIALDSLPGDRLLTDPCAARHVLLALLENACRYSPEGGVVRVAGSVTEDGSAMEIRVCDDGPGIHPDDRELVFDPFVSRSSSNGHPGLGLTMARTLSRQLGGSLRVDGDPAGGASLVFTLPLLRVDRVCDLVVRPTLEWARAHELAATAVLVQLSRQVADRAPDDWAARLRAGMRRSDRVIEIDDDVSVIVSPLGPRQRRALERRVVEVLGRIDIPEEMVWMEHITYPAPGVEEADFFGRIARMLLRGGCPGMLVENPTP